MPQDKQCCKFCNCYAASVLSCSPVHCHNPNCPHCHTPTSPKTATEEEILKEFEIHCGRGWGLPDDNIVHASKGFVKRLLSQAFKAGEALGQQNERQFILNILDGIDIADEQMGNNSGGTKAIRLALKSRIINPPRRN